MPTLLIQRYRRIAAHSNRIGYHADDDATPPPQPAISHQADDDDASIPYYVYFSIASRPCCIVSALHKERQLVGASEPASERTTEHRRAVGWMDGNSGPNSGGRKKSENKRFVIQVQYFYCPSIYRPHVVDEGVGPTTQHPICALCVAVYPYMCELWSKPNVCTNSSDIVAVS